MINVLAILVYPIGSLVQVASLLPLPDQIFLLLVVDLFLVVLLENKTHEMDSPLKMYFV